MLFRSSLPDNIACMRDETQGTDVGCEAAIIPHCRDATQLIVALHVREEKYRDGYGSRQA